jgi:hypothetical protein
MLAFAALLLALVRAVTSWPAMRAVLLPWRAPETKKRLIG